MLKIDQAFIKTTESNREYAAIVDAIVILAHNLNMKVTVESIEEADQIAQMIALDCDYGQGYYFSRPVLSELAEALIFPQLVHKNQLKRVTLPGGRSLAGGIVQIFDFKNESVSSKLIIFVLSKCGYRVTPKGIRQKISHKFIVIRYLW